MNRQMDYIIHAGLILILSAGIWKLVNQLPEKQNTTETISTIDPETDNTPFYSATALKGKTLFMSQCASCHNIYKNTTGPALLNFTERGPWGNRQNVYDWIHNPARFMANNAYAAELKKQFGGTMMTAFPNLTAAEIDAICDFVEAEAKKTGN